MRLSDYRALDPIGASRTLTRARLAPLLAVADPFRLHVVEREEPRLEVRRFRPLYADRWVCAYATNGTPRDRMRHDALVAGEAPLSHPYRRIALAP
jgi:hypothetical protein